MNIYIVYPYFLSKKYYMKLKIDVLEVSCRLVKHGHEVIVSRLEHSALPVMNCRRHRSSSNFSPCFTARVREHS